MSTTLLRSALDLLHYSGASAMARPFLGGMGAIFMLHHVFPGGGEAPGFAPNYGLEMTPEHLDKVLAMVKGRGYDLVSLDEAADRIEGRTPSPRRFAVFTLDDGYKDNLVHAAPLFRKHRCPYAIFVAPAITDGTCELWWRGLETVIATASRLSCVIDGTAHDLPAATPQEKWRAWDTVYRPVRNMDQHAQRRWIRDLCAAHGVDLEAQCRAAAMTWDELRVIAADPLCTIGAHTVHHFAVSRLSEDEARHELVASADRIARELGQRPRYFAYPYGDEGSAGPRDFRLAREAGFRAAVTTRKGLIFGAHRDHMTALPRASLSGKIMELRHARVLMDGLAFALFNRFRRVNVD
jgi:peptidoglycan/xylan/chitin deacetylase (PgdA/CDA1 family)